MVWSRGCHRSQSWRHYQLNRQSCSREHRRTTGVQEAQKSKITKGLMFDRGHLVRYKIARPWYMSFIQTSILVTYLLWAWTWVSSLWRLRWIWPRPRRKGPCLIEKRLLSWGILQGARGCKRSIAYHERACGIKEWWCQSIKMGSWSNYDDRSSSKMGAANPKARKD